MQMLHCRYTADELPDAFGIASLPRNILEPIPALQVLARVTNNVNYWLRMVFQTMKEYGYSPDTLGGLVKSAQLLSVEMKRCSAAVRPDSFGAAMDSAALMAHNGDVGSALDFVRSVTYLYEKCGEEEWP